MNLASLGSGYLFSEDHNTAYPAHMAHLHTFTHLLWARNKSSGWGLMKTYLAH